MNTENLKLKNDFVILMLTSGSDRQTSMSERGICCFANDILGEAQYDIFVCDEYDISCFAGCDIFGFAESDYSVTNLMTYGSEPNR